MRAGQYELGECLGRGSFGAVYRTRNLNTGGEAAVKVAFRVAGEDGIALLKHEGNMHSTLAGLPGVPQLKACGPWEKGYYLALPLLGMSLEKAVKDEGSAPGIPEMRITAALAVAMSVTQTLSKVHARGLLHRDVTPANIMFGRGGRGVWLCDFGLARPYRDEAGHVKESTGHVLVGTPGFASASVRAGVRPSRRDDIESLAYCVWYVLAGGELPWSGGGASRRLCDLAPLIEKTGHPVVMLMLSHARSLSFHAAPDYEALLLGIRQARISGQCIPPAARGPNE